MKRLLKRTKLKTLLESRLCRWQIKLSAGSGRYIQPINIVDFCNPSKILNWSTLFSTNQPIAAMFNQSTMLTLAQWRKAKNIRGMVVKFNQSTNQGYIQPINIVDSRNQFFGWWNVMKAELKLSGDSFCYMASSEEIFLICDKDTMMWMMISIIMRKLWHWWQELSL